MTRRLATGAAVVALLGLSCGRERPAPSVERDEPDVAVRYFDPAAEDVGREAAREYELTRPSITLENGGTHLVSGCRDFLQWTSRDAQPSTDRDGATMSSYVMCAVAALAPGGRRAGHSYFDEQALGDVIYRKLDLRSFGSSLRAEADAGKPHLADMTLAAVSVTPTAVDVETPDWRFSFQALAASDFDGDGTGDLLVAYTEAAKRGTAFQSLTLLLRRSAADADVIASIPAPPSSSEQ